MGLTCDLCLFFPTLGDWGAGAGSASPGSGRELTQDWLGAVLWVPAQRQGPGCSSPGGRSSVRGAGVGAGGRGGLSLRLVLALVLTPHPGRALSAVLEVTDHILLAH